MMQETRSSNRQAIAPAFMLLSAAAVSLTGCEKKPGGQVVAVVNSEEITQQELRAEAEANNVPATGFQAAAPSLLDRVIQRNLLADYARSKGMDRTPEYVTRRRLLDQTLLSSLALRSIVGTPTKPAPGEVEKFIAANPSIFQKREQLALDQIRLPTPNDVGSIKALTALGTLSAIEAKLRASGTQFARGNTGLDTGTLDPLIAQQIGTFPNGRVFDLAVGGTTFISVIVDRKPIATAPTNWTSSAASLMERQRAEEVVTRTIRQLRKDAKISFDPAFKPKEPPKN